MAHVHKPGDTYLIVGRDARGKRFRMSHPNPHYLSAHNVYSGRMYAVRDGKRVAVVKVWSN